MLEILQLRLQEMAVQFDFTIFNSVGLGATKPNNEVNGDKDEDSSPFNTF